MNIKNVLIFVVAFPLIVFAHGGGLDSSGCHHNRKQGGYHCHRGSNFEQQFSSKQDMLESNGASEVQLRTVQNTQKRPNFNDKKSLPVGSYSGRAVGITDGDTFKLLIDNHQYKIRLAEIDTPEKGQPYGTKAKQALSSLIFNKAVQVNVLTVDRYGRSVGRIFVNGIDVNASLVSQGAAWVYRKYVTDESLFEIEDAAKREEMGLWSLPEADREPPWEWRKSKRERK